MDRLSHILPAVLQKRGLTQHADAALVLHRASAWLSEHLPAHRTILTPRALQEDGTLLIECDQSSAAQECLAALPHLKIFLREECGFLPVRTIRLVRTRAEPERKKT
ncbi:MAG TPA: hypothetical protein DEB30_03925 [Candidatus Peribacter riflensis]|uniref:DUF721 domain-containing protein n=1 Tax=Candidatus Peribacter riflensis TaxID=1735162 RepID=A0A0S1ST56_9BACT|nr:MAG: hypothetical protein PeribacterA2_0417 [Candidatus Peribacter riflensis]OGJ76735.1 MAG: hypothetical protein A2398_01055 [Candidatus Peribacteria bacterium RIFOXYB1_FULL_57_12]ALM10902.1 MAG: hypothetical protein PeribacterB2_0416 [Candidatus Peribacter riflensis]ALM12005.1 MAG: hypothetical protein PeribacterC2_0416 [Candidatus Peribacter riflensis]ALM13108.1 MAG: hypothetical protein PeribacterD1_0417 [Candidatus Peribacter riflensis]